MRGRFFVSSVVALGIFVSGAVCALAKAPDSFADLAESLKPGVVNIYTSKIEKRNPFGEGFGGFDQDFFRKFFNQPPGDFKSRSLGSGFIWDEKGHIVTNNHVVDGAEEISVRTEDGKNFDAKVIGVDADTDLALLKIDSGSAKLKPVQTGDSDKIRVGDWVLAIGNPNGLTHTVTAGIVSAKGRNIGAGPYDSFIQTDADINPGNSGGPLFDMDGKVVGVNSIKFIGEAVSGIGFAIPVNRVKDIVGQLQKGGKVTRGWLGVSIQPVTDDLAESLKLKDNKGALVADVFDNGPAKKAGIKRGDIITKIDGELVEKQNDLPYMVAKRSPGTTVNVELIRDGETKTISVTLAERKGNGAESSMSETEKSDMGLTVQEITPDLTEHLDIKVKDGVVITDIKPGSPAGEAGLKRGDVIVEVNRIAVTDMESYRSALKESANKKSTLFVVVRGKATSYVVVKHKK